MHRLYRRIIKRAAIETKIFALDPNRPNLVARITGEGRAALLLLYGHVDVVTTANQQWTHPPFGGKLVDGFIWGRGALDMKSDVASLDFGTDAIFRRCKETNKFQKVLR